MALQPKTDDVFSAENNLKTVTRTKVYQEIVDQIRKLIEEGKLKPGDRLPPERRLTEIFSVSRHSVREAIRILEEQHILVSRMGSGTFVVTNDEASVDGVLLKAFREQKVKLAEIFQFRRMIEPQIAAQAALKATKTDILELKLILEQQKEAGDNFKLAVNLDQSFHIALAKATNNSVLLSVVERLNDILAESRVEISKNTDRLDRSIKSHAQIIQAVVQGDEKAATEAMEEHLLQVEELTFSDSME